MSACPPRITATSVVPSSSLGPGKSEGKSKLADIIDVEAARSLLEDFYALTQLTVALLDLEGNALVGVGWQDICTKFHRVNPESCRNCIESDTRLTKGIAEGEYRLYKCKNNMWDVATPLFVHGQHVGNMFSGQFFFCDEPLDYELFRAQARRYGFDEERYFAALEALPRFTRKFVSDGMRFLSNLAHRMGYSNVELARSLADRKRSEEALIRSEKLASVGRMAAAIAHEINNPPRGHRQLHLPG